MAEKKGKKLRITQIHSGNGRPRSHRRTLEALGLQHHQDVVEQPDNEAIRGMIEKVSHLIEVEEV